MLVKMIRKALFKTGAGGGEMELNSTHNRAESGFIADEQCEGISGWKSLRENIKGMDSLSGDLLGFSLKAG